MYKLYRIPNCNTVKKAMTHLDKSKIPYEFINFKKTAPTKEQIELWKEAFGDWPVNKKGPTYRKIKDDFESLPPSKKIKLLIETTSAIKRPILMKANTVKHFGYDEDFYDSIK